MRITQSHPPVGLVKKVISPYIEEDKHMTAIKVLVGTYGLVLRNATQTRLWNLLKSQLQTKGITNLF